MKHCLGSVFPLDAAQLVTALCPRNASARVVAIAVLTRSASTDAGHYQNGLPRHLSGQTMELDACSSMKRTFYEPPVAWACSCTSESSNAAIRSL